MSNNIELQPSSYLDLYKYLLVLSEVQITKLRNIAVGILGVSSFTNAEIQDLEKNLSLFLSKQ